MTKSNSNISIPLAPANSISVKGITVNYTANCSPSKKPTLVLIHGFGASLETWTDIYPELCEQYSVIRLDLKGAGFSSKPRDEQYAPIDQARLVLAFLTALRQTNVVLVGHSLGGGIALLSYFLSTNSQELQIKGLILIDSAGYSQELPFFVSAVRNPIPEILSNLLPARYRAKHVLERLFVDQTKITEERIDRYAFFLNTLGNRYALNQTAKQILPENVARLTAEFPTIRVPTLIVWGEEDDVIPITYAQRFTQDIPNSRLVILPETGHMPQEERSHETFQAIHSFMQAIK